MNYYLYPALKLDFPTRQTPSCFGACLITSENHYEMFKEFEASMQTFFDTSIDKFTSEQTLKFVMERFYELVKIKRIDGVFRSKRTQKYSFIYKINYSN